MAETSLKVSTLATPPVSEQIVSSTPPLTPVSQASWVRPNKYAAAVVVLTAAALGAYAASDYYLPALQEAGNSLYSSAEAAGAATREFFSGFVTASSARVADWYTTIRDGSHYRVEQLTNATSGAASAVHSLGEKIINSTVSAAGAAQCAADAVYQAMPSPQEVYKAGQTGFDVMGRMTNGAAAALTAAGAGLKVTGGAIIHGQRLIGTAPEHEQNPHVVAAGFLGSFSLAQLGLNYLTWAVSPFAKIALEQKTRAGFDGVARLTTTAAVTAVSLNCDLYGAVASGINAISSLGSRVSQFADQASAQMRDVLSDRDVVRFVPSKETVTSGLATLAALTTVRTMSLFASRFFR